MTPWVCLRSPGSWSREMTSATRRIMLKVPIRLMRTTFSNAASEAGPSLPRIFIGVPTPAQLTRTRGVPRSDAIVATVVSPASASAISIANARPPMRSATAFAASPLRSSTATFAPPSVSLIAVASPSPDPPPVTVATLFLRSMGSLLDCSRLSSGRVEIAETHAAITVDRGSGYEARRLAAQPRHCISDVDALPEARQRQGAANALCEFSVGREARQAFGVGDGTGRDGVDPDAFHAPFERQAAGQHLDSGLGRTGMGLHRHGALGLGGRDVDQHRARSLEVRISSREHIEGTDEVYVDDRLEGIGRHLGRRHEEVARSTRYNDVDRSLGVGDLGHDRLHGGCLAYVAGMMGHVETIGAQGIGRRRDSLRRAPDDRDLRAERTQPVGDTQVDAARCAHHDRVAAGQALGVKGHAWIS